jgi:hypothetical protein
MFKELFEDKRISEKKRTSQLFKNRGFLDELKCYEYTIWFLFIIGKYLNHIIKSKICK